MKLHNLTYIGGFAALAVAAFMLATHADVDVTTDALAAGTDGAISVTCTAPTATAFTPAVAYTLTIAAPAVGTVPSGTSHTVSSALTGAVSADTNPSTSTVNHTTTNKVNFWHLAPKLKIGGLQCSTNTQAALAAEGDAADDANFEISFQDLTGTTYTSTKKVDTVNTGADNVVFGTGGLVTTTSVLDTDDSQAASYDGEVTFGPGATTAKGGFRVVNEVKYIGLNPSVTETLRMTMTGS